MATKEINMSMPGPEPKEKLAYLLEFPDTLEECIAAYTEETVYSLFVIGASTQARNMARAFSVSGDDEKPGPTADEVLAKLAAWKPATAGMRTTKDPLAESVAKFKTMSHEEQAAYIRSLQEAAGL